MPTMIQIRNVPDKLHRKAKARAALEGVTLSDFAMNALRRAVEQPTMAEIAARVRELPHVETGVRAADVIRQDQVPN